MTDIWVDVVVLILMLLLSAFFSSAETSLTAVSPIKMRTLEEQGNKKAKAVLFLLEHESKMLSAILIGNNLVNTYMATLASMIAMRFGGGYIVSAATFLITFLILVFGEITPKTLAQRKPESMAMLYAPVIRLLMWVLTPVIWFINLFSQIILRLFGVKKAGRSASITESELNTIIDVSHEEGVIEAEEREMIKNVFEFTDAKAREIMVPRVHVTSIDINTSYDDLMKLYARDRFTRIPVYEENRDNIVGIVNMKDLLLVDKDSYDLKKLLRKPYFTIESKNISELMQEMQKDQYNMTIVLDEYGELAGILTLEDIIEEIVGEVQDEFDASENENIVKIGEGKYKVKGYLSLHDLNDELHLNLDSEDFDSIGGLVIEKLGRFPVLSESIELDNGVRLRVVALNKNRIEDVILELPQPEQSRPEQPEEKEDFHMANMLRLEAPLKLKKADKTDPGEKPDNPEKTDAPENDPADDIVPANGSEGLKSSGPQAESGSKPKANSGAGQNG